MVIFECWLHQMIARIMNFNFTYSNRENSIDIEVELELESVEISASQCLNWTDKN